MSRSFEVEDQEILSLPVASDEARRRIATRAYPAANGAIDDFSDGLVRRLEVPVGREITVSNRSGVRKILPES